MSFLRLKRSGGGAPVVVARLLAALAVMLLAAVMLALFPAVAEAQTETQAEAQTEDKGTSAVVVVRPGDSLWSISEEHLGANATPQRIVEGTAQIYALNRDRIGADPDLILVGQELLLPPAMVQSERPTGTTAAAPKKTAKAAEAAEASPRDQAAKSSTKSKAPKPAPGTAAVGGADAGGVQASETVAQRRASLPTLPNGAAAAQVPAVRAVAPNDAQPWSSAASFLRTLRTEFASAASALAESFFGASADSRADGRQLLGVGVLVLTLVVAALIAWRLPMRRTTSRDAERWGTSSGYYGYYNGETPAASPPIPFGYYPGSLGSSPGDRDEQEAPQEARREAPRALGRGQQVLLTGSESVSAASAGRPPKATRAKARAVPRNGLALGAHNPKVRRAPRRVHATMRARKLRPQRGTLRRSRAPIALRQTKGGSTRDGH